MASLHTGAGLSTDIDAAVATAEAAAQATANFGDETPNLVVTFLSYDHRDFADDVAAFLGERFPAAAVIGCTAQGVIGGERELEHGPSVSVFAAFLPDTAVTPFGLRFIETDGTGEYVGWPHDLSPDATLLMLCDRFSFPAGHLLQSLNETRPGTIVSGGLATGGARPGDTRLFYGGQVFDHGAVAVAVSGRVRVKTMVSQGCRPIGNPMTVTRADRNILFELGGERPLDRVRDVWTNSSPRDRSLIQSGLQIGRVVDEYKTDFERGDFLIRPVVGSDAESGFIAVGDVLEIGETVQFHVRDPETADEDLRHHIDVLDGRPAGALLFTCNGRGTNLFAEPDHDAGLIAKSWGIPVAGLFCAGELGPVGGRNFLHGQTASVALFCDTAR
ncbi:MAG TPA: FIST N-terminal domain-containing protein [Actinomycetota bacterium]|nr:FIST N-terminal domain-containing protein [Actinomycetota bacterium]